MRDQHVTTTFGEDNCLVVTPSGDLDAFSAAGLRRVIAEALSKPGATTTLCCDLSNVEFLDSGGLGALVGAYRAARRAGISFFLVRPSHRSRRMLRWTQLDRIIPTYPTLDDALGALAELGALGAGRSAG